MKNDLKRVSSIFSLIFLFGYIVFGHILLGRIGLISAGIVEIYTVYLTFKNDNYIDFIKVLFALFFLSLGLYLPYI